MSTVRVGSRLPKAPHLLGGRRVLTNLWLEDSVDPWGDGSSLFHGLALFSYRCLDNLQRNAQRLGWYSSNQQLALLAGEPPSALLLPAQNRRSALRDEGRLPCLVLTPPSLIRVCAAAKVRVLAPLGILVTFSKTAIRRIRCLLPSDFFCRAAGSRSPSLGPALRAGSAWQARRGPAAGPSRGCGVLA